jgi:hypothetical protein
LSCWSASGSLRAALNSWCISIHPLFGLCAHYFLAFLLFPVLLICFLHRLFISGSSLFIVSVFHVDFPEFFFFHIPELLSRFWISLHISLNVVSSFISLFISIGSFLFVYFCEFWFVSLSLSPLYFLP